MDTNNVNCKSSDPQNLMYAKKHDDMYSGYNNFDYVSEASHSPSKPTTRKEEPEEDGTQSDGTTQQTGQELWEWYVMVIAVVVAVVAVVAAQFLSSWSNTNITQEDTEKILHRVTELRGSIKGYSKEFPSQNKTIWAGFSSGIITVQEKPPVFLLLHETEEETSACLARKIGSLAAHFLNATNPNPLLLDGADIEHNETLHEDYGILLEEYRTRVEKQCAVIINNLQKIPGIVARFLHFLCDDVTPFVPKSVYFLTMKVSRINHVTDNPTALAEEELNRLWSGHLNQDILKPLVTRITGMAMVIMPEKNLTSCSER
jgi:hypothetical protein